MLRMVVKIIEISLQSVGAKGHRKLVIQRIGKIVQKKIWLCGSGVYHEHGIRESGKETKGEYV